jgi:regulator of sigma E protease
MAGGRACATTPERAEEQVIQGVLNGAVTLVAFLFMLGLLVLVHELGHFWTARRLGIKVDEFGIGYPPRAATLFERGGVRYTLNWIPIGGFVRFGGEGGDSIYGVGSLAAAPPWKKIAVLAAGPLMNLLLAILIFVGLLLVNGAPQVVDGARIGEVYPNTPAAAAGFQTGDVLLVLAGQPIGQDTKAITAIARAHKGEAIPAIVERGGQRVTLMVTPGPWTTPDGEQREVGFGFAYNAHLALVPVGPLQAIALGVATTFDLLGRFIEGLGQLIGGLLGLNQAPPGGVTGVVGIARGTGEVIQRDGLTGFWQWTALLSLNLFLFNLLPIPALDGSHIMFALIELARRGKKIPPEREAMVHAVGFMMLIGLMVVITFFDIRNWIGGASVLGG